MAVLKTEKNPTLIKIGEKVRKLRKQNPDYVNYEVFAFNHKINKVTLQRVERGENYNMESIIKILNALDIGLSEFFKDIDQI